MVILGYALKKIGCFQLLSIRIILVLCYSLQCLLPLELLMIGDRGEKR